MVLPEPASSVPTTRSSSSRWIGSPSTVATGSGTMKVETGVGAGVGDATTAGVGVALPDERFLPDSARTGKACAMQSKTRKNVRRGSMDGWNRQFRPTGRARQGN